MNIYFLVEGGKTEPTLAPFDSHTSPPKVTKTPQRYQLLNRKRYAPLNPHNRSSQRYWLKETLLNIPVPIDPLFRHIDPLGKNGDHFNSGTTCSEIKQTSDQVLAQLGAGYPAYQTKSKIGTLLCVLFTAKTHIFKENHLLIWSNTKTYLIFDAKRISRVSLWVKRLAVAGLGLAEASVLGGLY